jgi:hypothetical protein
VDEDQRRDLLRRAEHEVRRVSREHGQDSPRARAQRQRQLGLERSTAAELGLPYAQRVDSIGVVEFKRMTSIKIGSPNDEVLRRHPLWGSGLESYSAHEVKNSPWITELMDVDRAHERFDESQWSGRHHFVLTFHDETLECVANWTVTRTAPAATMPEVLARLSAEAL